MQSKYKVGLLRANLLLAALLLALIAPSADSASEGLLLWLASGWLGVTAALLEFSHRRPATVPWQLLPSLLLAALLWVSPERYLIWLWAWAILVMLPQPRWMAGVNLLLATATWWPLMTWLPPPQALIAASVLAGMLVIGLTRQLGLLALHGPARGRMRLIPGLRLWSRDQLADDLQRERLRARREGVHAELLLLQTSPRRLWPLAHRLCHATRRFESCYRLDRRTLATLLLSRDSEQAESRRRQLLESIGSPSRWHAACLSSVASLHDAYRPLQGRSPPDEGSPHG